MFSENFCLASLSLWGKINTYIVPTFVGRIEELVLKFICKDLLEKTSSFRRSLKVKICKSG
jgi:hypothetical protein